MEVIMWSFIMTALAFACYGLKYVRRVFAVVGVCVFGLWLAGTMGIGHFVLSYGQDQKILVPQNAITTSNTPKEI